MAQQQLPPRSDDDLVAMKSEDGCVFEIKAYFLKAGSGLFRDLLSASPSSAAAYSSKSPVELPAHSSIVHLFCQLMLQHELRKPVLLSPTHPAYECESHPLGVKGSIARFFAALIELCDFAQCSTAIQERAVTYFMAHLDPWSFLSYAAVMEHKPLAKDFIRTTDDLDDALLETIDPAKIRTPIASQLPKGWIMAYLCAHATATREEEGGASHLSIDHPNAETTTGAKESFWTKVAHAFVTPEDGLPSE